MRDTDDIAFGILDVNHSADAGNGHLGDHDGSADVLDGCDAYIHFGHLHGSDIGIDGQSLQRTEPHAADQSAVDPGFTVRTGDDHPVINTKRLIRAMEVHHQRAAHQKAVAPTGYRYATSFFS